MPVAASLQRLATEVTHALEQHDPMGISLGYGLIACAASVALITAFGAVGQELNTSYAGVAEAVATLSTP